MEGSRARHRGVNMQQGSLLGWWLSAPSSQIVLAHSGTAEILGRPGRARETRVDKLSEADMGQFPFP